MSRLSDKPRQRRPIRPPSIGNCVDQKQYFERLNGRGYQSHFGGQLYVGLGAMDHVDRIEIVWPNSREPMVLSDVVVDQRLVVIEP